MIFAAIYIQFFDLGHGMVTMLLIALLLSVWGQMGDLAESALKRYYGVKDSGKILPGHGGILDRFDSLLFVLPMIHWLGLV
jgi:phosphatidate cytidylyltransferase